MTDQILSQTASMQDVARAAGVSIATVSNVLNHPQRVTASTTARVQRAIAQLNFVPNGVARTLAAGGSRSLGMVVTDIKNSFFVDLAVGAQAAAKDADFKLLLANSGTDYTQQDDYLTFFDESRVPGILLTAMEDSDDGIERLRSHGRRVVLINFRADTSTHCMVLMDNEQAGYLATRHLISRGCRRILFVGGPEELQPVADRRRGAQRAAAAHVDVEMRDVAGPGVNEPDGRDAARMILAQDVPPDGIVASSMLTARGLVEEMVRADGPRIPEEVQVIACENNREAAAGSVEISCVVPPAASMGAEAVRLLLAEMAESALEHRHETVTLPSTLHVARSTR